MPLIKTIDSFKIYIYPFDHAPPHFHAIYVEYEELIEIKTLETYTGGLPTKQRKKAFVWAEENREYLLEQWNYYNPDN